jgi:hypothetical protein
MGWFILGIICFFIAFIFAANDYDPMAVWGLCILGFAFIFIVLIQEPTAMDLHAGKAVIKYEVVDGVKVDSTFVFRD